MDCKYLGVAMVYYYSGGDLEWGESEILKIGNDYYTMTAESGGGRFLARVLYNGVRFYKVGGGLEAL